MAKIGYRLRSKANKAVSIYVNFRVPNSLMLEVKTGLSVKPDEWSVQKQRVKGKDGFLQQLNYTLNDLSSFLVQEINLASTNGNLIDRSWLIKAVDSFFNRADVEDPIFLLNFYRSFLKRVSENKDSEVGLKDVTIKGYRTFFKILSDYENDLGKTIRFDHLDKAFFEDFHSWLLNERKYKPSNINRHLSRLKTVCRDAESLGIKVNPLFASFKPKKTHQEKYFTIINEEEFELIKSFEPSENYLINAKKWLLIGLCIGQRVSDLLSITSSNVRNLEDGYCLIDITQQKTATNVTIPVKDPHVLNIIEHSFPHSISSQRFNDYIKEICKRCGINSETKGYIRNKELRDELVTGPKWMFVSSHDLRRSFATNFFHKGVKVPLLMSITGHKRESTFFGYIGHKFTKDEQAQAFLKYL